MEFTNVIEAENLYKKLGHFELNIPQLRIPQGFATALIGENGAGKTTLLNILSGIRLDAKGEINWFGETTDIDRGNARDRIGYTGPGHYYLPGWNTRQVRRVMEILFDDFDAERFARWCEALAIDTDGFRKDGKPVSKLSDGNRMKLMLAGVLARDTELLILDEPASPLDPLMRDRLNDILRGYLASGQGGRDASDAPQGDALLPPVAKSRSVFFSTHNIADMEAVTDYAIILTHGTVAEEGFVEDLKEKYVLVKGEPDSADIAKSVLYSYSASGSYGYEGMCLAEDLDKLAGCNISTEAPTLTQISVAVMKRHSMLQL
ncbi:MAG: ABC transporter ATP-binding protein [Lachnospiraceae bacterium]|nr:ABC transporter ATP-binding protein [Lachnospiraceae bacterium]